MVRSRLEIAVSAAAIRSLNFFGRVQAELVGRALAILRIEYLRPFSFLWRVAWLDPLSVFPQRRQAMRLQLAGSNCCDRAVVFVVVVGNVLFGNLLHQRYRNLLEMCLGLLHCDYSLLIV